MRHFLERFKILGVSMEIINQALKNRHTKKVKMADNIIAATVRIHNLTLVTNNESDFNGLSLDMVNPVQENI